MTHKNIGWRGKPLHEEPHLFVDMQIERTQHLKHPLTAQPILHGTKEGRKDSRVILTLASVSFCVVVAVNRTSAPATNLLDRGNGTTN